MSFYWGWEKCGHGLTSRPRETSDPVFLDFLLEVFDYPAESGRLLLAGELPLRYYSGNFALRKPSWSLPEVGGVQGILTPGSPDVGLVRVQVARDQVHSGGCWTRGAGGTWKRVRLTKKTASTLVRKMVLSMSCTARDGRGFVLLVRLWIGGLQ